MLLRRLIAISNPLFLFSLFFFFSFAYFTLLLVKICFFSNRGDPFLQQLVILVHIAGMWKSVKLN